jgi:hypothetical protein
MTENLPPANPLCWPETQLRSRSRVRSAFRTKLDGAVKNVTTSLRLFGNDCGKAMGAVSVTCNASLFSHNPSDPGVAVWFMWDGGMRCIAVDRYETLPENLQAIHHVIEARRTEMKHAGIEMVRTTFKGFLALPPPPQGQRWHDVLGVPPNATAEAISEARKALARTHSGDEARMTAINVAHDQGMKGLTK